MSDDEGPSRKRRGVQSSACDECHRRKVRCDGDNVPGNVCSECSTMNLQCTRIVAKKKRGPKLGSTRKRQTSLPQDSVQSLIDAILTGLDMYSVPTSADVVRGMLLDLAKYTRELEKELDTFRREKSVESHPSTTSPPSTTLPTEREAPPPRSEIDLDEALGDRLKGLTLKHYRGRHFGQSSHFMLLSTALDMRDDLNGDPQSISVHLKRSEFWDLKPWHVVAEHDPIPYTFPPEDLLKSLVNLYFQYFHPYYPLLHRPIFEKQVFEQKLHLRDRSFGSVVLIVCALSSRHSDDSRVLYNNAKSMHSAGWKYFNQVEFVPKSFVVSPSVYALQIYPLSVTFIHATHMAEISWVLIGPGIRLAESVGVHRSGFGKGRDPVEVELWKRAFWQLVVFDTASSMGLGRPRASNTNDLDLELPTVCDDEYWEAENAFKQPEDKPSYMAFWIHYIVLIEIIGFAQRSIYSARRLDPWGPTSLSAKEWNQKAVMEIDSALNKWMDKLPDHLKYDPHRENSVFAHQSVMLYSTYYWALIQLHRPFITRPGQKSILSYPSLAICSNAARACIHLLDSHHQRYKMRLAHLMPSIFSCAIVILINLWRGIRAKVSFNATKEMNDVEKCLIMLSMYENRFEMAGRLRDILLSIISVSQLPPMEEIPSSKRTRDPDTTSSSLATNNPEAAQVRNEAFSRPIAGSQRVSNSQYSNSIEITPSFDFSSFTVPFDAQWPVTSNELGGMPIHHDMDMTFESLAKEPEDISLGQTATSQYEWNRFMSDVDELLSQLVQ